MSEGTPEDRTRASSRRNGRGRGRAGRQPEPARIAIFDPLDPSRIIETLDTLDPELDTCVGRRHRRRRGETVKVQIRPRGRVDGVTAEMRPGEWGDGVVLTEGFDLDRRHVGWVGVPGTTVMWRRHVLVIAPASDLSLFVRAVSAVTASSLSVEVWAPDRGRWLGWDDAAEEGKPL